MGEALIENDIFSKQNKEPRLWTALISTNKRVGEVSFNRHGQICTDFLTSWGRG
jgi:hypothetical protein